MVISLKHLFTSPKTDGTDTTIVQPSNWNAEHQLQMATARLIGRTTAGTGAAEEISVGANLSLTALTLNLAGSVSITALTASGALSGGSLTISGDADFTGTGAIKVPVGTTAQRPTPATGDLRFNSSVSQFEGYNGTVWSSVGGGATGGGPDQVFYENSKVVTTNYTITSGKNAMSAGPITINASISVTIPSGSVWTVV
jgi:hypothetical protein